MEPNDVIDIGLPPTPPLRKWRHKDPPVEFGTEWTENEVPRPEEEEEEEEEEEPDVFQDPEYETKEVQALRIFKDWAQQQPHFVDCRLDSNFLLRFLRMRKLDVPKAQQVLDKYLTVRTHHPFCYHRLDVEIPGVTDLISKGYLFPLPERDDLGRVVIFGVSGVMDMSCQQREDVFKTFVMTFEALLEDEINQKLGVTYVFDQGGINLSQVYQLGLRDVQRLLSTGEKAIPVRHKDIHWVFLPRYLKAIYDVFKTFLSPKLQKRLSVHDEVDGIPEYIPRRILPKEYGGTVPLAHMTAQWIEILREKRGRLLALDKMRVDETRRPKVKHHKFGIMSFVTSWVRVEAS